MIVESNHVIDWFNNLAPVYQPMKTKSNCALHARFSPRFEQVKAFEQLGLFKKA